MDKPTTVKRDYTKYSSKSNKLLGGKKEEDKETVTLEERYQACMVLHAVGDTIGYKNGEWEFNIGKDAGDALAPDVQFRPEISDTRVFEFMELGGINGIDLKDWVVSDDTIFHLHTALSIELCNVFQLNEDSPDTWTEAIFAFGEEIVTSYIMALERSLSRDIGLSTLKYLQQISKGVAWNKIPPAGPGEMVGGGSGAAMRTACIGLLYPGKHNRLNLIAAAIESSRITHNNPVGYLGGMTAALFTAFAIEGVPVEKWPFEMLELIEWPKTVLHTYLRETRGYEEFLRDAEFFCDSWRKYLDKFFKGSVPALPFTSPSRRIHWFREYLDFRSGQIGFVGRGGHDSVIIAYDSLLRTCIKNQSWEKLVYYAALHSGDSDTTGSIAGAWYGAMFGFKDIPHNMTANLEQPYKNMLYTSGSKLYEKAKTTAQA
jgi:ADP-ribosylarginine hydrolase